MAFFACHSRVDIPRDLIHYSTKEIEKKFAEIACSYSHEASKILAQNLLNECSIRNTKVLCSLGYYALTNPGVSVVNKTNIVQMFVVMSQVREYYSLLVYRSGILRLLFKFGMVLKTENRYCFKKSVPKSEYMKFSKYVVHTIEELSNPNSYPNLCTDGVPLGVRRLTEAAKSVKAKLVKKGVRFTISSWDMPYHRNGSLNTLGGSDDMVSVKLFTERFTELQNNVDAIETDIEGHQIFSREVGSSMDNGVDEMMISDFISTLSLYEYKAQNLIQESVESEEMALYEELVSMLDYIKHMINKLKSKICVTLDPTFIQDNLDTPDYLSTYQARRSGLEQGNMSREGVQATQGADAEGTHANRFSSDYAPDDYTYTPNDFDPFPRVPSYQVVEDYPISYPAHNPRAFGVPDGQFQNSSAERSTYSYENIVQNINYVNNYINNRLNSNEPQNETRLTELESREQSEKIKHESLGQHLKAQERPEEARDKLSHKDSMLKQGSELKREEFDANEINDLLNYQGSSDLEYLHQSVDPRLPKKSGKDPSVVQSSVDSSYSKESSVDLFKLNRQTGGKKEDESAPGSEKSAVGENVVLTKGSVAYLRKKSADGKSASFSKPVEKVRKSDGSIPSAVALERESSEVVETDGDDQELTTEMSYVMDTLKRINTYLESKPPRFVANSRSYQTIQSTSQPYTESANSANLVKGISDKALTKMDEVEHMKIKMKKEEALMRDWISATTPTTKVSATTTTKGVITASGINVGKDGAVRERNQLFDSFDENLVTRLSNAHTPRKSVTVSSSVLPFDNTLVKSSITSVSVEDHHPQCMTAHQKYIQKHHHPLESSSSGAGRSTGKSMATPVSRSGVSTTSEQAAENALKDLVKELGNQVASESLASVANTWSGTYGTTNYPTVSYRHSYSGDSANDYRAGSSRSYEEYGVPDESGKDEKGIQTCASTSSRLIFKKGIPSDNFRNRVMTRSIDTSDEFNVNSEHVLDADNNLKQLKKLTKLLLLREEDIEERIRDSGYGKKEGYIRTQSDRFEEVFSDEFTNEDRMKKEDKVDKVKDVDSVGNDNEYDGYDDADEELDASSRHLVTGERVKKKYGGRFGSRSFDKEDGKEDDQEFEEFFDSVEKRTGQKQQRKSDVNELGYPVIDLNNIENMKLGTFSEADLMDTPKGSREEFPIGEVESSEFFERYPNQQGSGESGLEYGVEEQEEYEGYPMPEYPKDEYEYEKDDVEDENFEDYENYDDDVYLDEENDMDQVASVVDEDTFHIERARGSRSRYGEKSKYATGSKYDSRRTKHLVRERGDENRYHESQKGERSGRSERVKHERLREEKSGNTRYRDVDDGINAHIGEERSRRERKLSERKMKSRDDGKFNETHYYNDYYDDNYKDPTYDDEYHDYDKYDRHDKYDNHDRHDKYGNHDRYVLRGDRRFRVHEYKKERRTKPRRYEHYRYHKYGYEPERLRRSNTYPLKSHGSKEVYGMYQQAYDEQPYEEEGYEYRRNRGEYAQTGFGGYSNYLQTNYSNYANAYSAPTFRNYADKMNYIHFSTSSSRENMYNDQYNDYQRKYGDQRYGYDNNYRSSHGVYSERYPEKYGEGRIVEVNEEEENQDHEKDDRYGKYLKIVNDQERTMKSYLIHEASSSNSRRESFDQRFRGEENGNVSSRTAYEPTMYENEVSEGVMNTDGKSDDRIVNKDLDQVDDGLMDKGVEKTGEDGADLDNDTEVQRSEIDEKIADSNMTDKSYNMEFSNKANTDMNTNLGSHLGSRTDEEEMVENLDDDILTNSQTVKKTIKGGGDVIYEDNMLSIEYAHSTKFSPNRFDTEYAGDNEVTLEIALTVQNTSLFSYVLSFDYSNFENFPINVKFLNRKFKGVEAKPGERIAHRFSAHCFGPFVGLPKLVIKANLDVNKQRFFHIYLPIAISCFFTPSLDLSSLSEKYFNSDKFKHIMKNKVYFNTHKKVHLAQLLNIVTGFGRFRLLQQAENCYYLASTFSAPFYATSRELYRFTIFAMVEATVSHYHVHVSSDSYRLANSTSMLLKYLLQN
ncbi:hypothetical protein MACK_002428 [Theileria orientalis]|uniref:Uncharacterized protein n=1 Tax=Theileria orientalis TaxID=68886 RepID=A0A976MDS4_THEOR|nr:hypothetical protein MACK_002428 [Theileria orientalis]